MKLYLGGKMMGVPGFGFKGFDQAAAELRSRGYEVFNPAERDRAAGFRAVDTDGSWAAMRAQGFDRRTALGADLAWIVANSEGMVALPSWRESPGTKAEIALHQGLYLPVWEMRDFLKLGTAASPLPPLRAGRKAKVK